MAAGRHMIVLCVLTAAPRALVAFSPAASARPMLPSFTKGVGVCQRPLFPATGRLPDLPRGRTRAAGVPLRAVSTQGAPAEKGTRKGSGYGEFSVTSEGEMDALLESGVELEQLCVEGAVTGGRTLVEHPVLKVLQDRRASGSKPQERTDGHKVALVIEGGGMRGCVSAGMIASVADLGFKDGIDGVFGSSAGSLVGAYFVGNQKGMPQYGCSLYYDLLTDELGKSKFIDRSQALNLLGLGPLRWFTLRPLKEMLGLREERPLLNLEYLLKDCVEDLRPLDWEGFWANNAKTPLHIMASDIEGGKSVVLHAAGGHFQSLREMTRCMTASMCLPAVAGSLAKVPGVEGWLADAQLYEPIPFRSAFEMGYTHALVLRTRPDGSNVVPKKSWIEQRMMRRFFSLDYKLPAVGEYLAAQKHKEVYARDILRLNNLASSDGASGQALTVALPAGVVEVKRIEKSREVIFEGVRSGYRAAYLALAGLGPPDAHCLAEVEDAVEKALPLDCIREPALLSGPAWLQRFAGTFGSK